MTSDVTEVLKREEGFVPHAYKDHLGYWTIGYGILIDERKGGGITREESAILLANRVRDVRLRLRANWRFFDGLDVERQSALVLMAYQMGVENLLKFKKTLALITSRDFEEAAAEALRSDWAKQTPERARRVANLIRTGEYDV